MKLWKKISLFAVMVFYSGLLFSQEQQYTYEDLCGIWVYESSTTITDCDKAYWNEFFVFNHNHFVFIPTHHLDCTAWNRFELRKYGFTEECFEAGIDSIYDKGRYLTYTENGDFWSWCCFELEKKEHLSFFYHECSYLERLPKKAQIVLYDNSRNDHRNYAREFLEYDICGVKNKGCQLLDSLLQPMGITIPKGDIVVVRDTCGDVLQVEYEPERDKYITGYLRKEELEFVQTNE